MGKLRLTKSGSKAQPLDGIPYPGVEGISLPKGGRRPWGGGECARLQELHVQDTDARKDKARAEAALGTRG